MNELNVAIEIIKLTTFVTLRQVRSLSMHSVEELNLQKLFINIT